MKLTLMAWLRPLIASDQVLGKFRIRRAPFSAIVFTKMRWQVVAVGIANSSLPLCATLSEHEREGKENGAKGGWEP